MCKHIVYHFLAWFLNVLMFFSASASAEPILTTPEIIQSATQALLSCNAYKIVGLCHWLECDFSGCHPNQTPRVQHYVPEFIVFVYPEYKKLPWAEYQLLQQAVDSAATLSLALSDGHLAGDRFALQDTMLFEAAVVGHPILPILSPHFLKGRATPGFVYFNSLLDATMWRGGEDFDLTPPQYLASLTRNNVSSWLAHFGTVYPRTGFIMQNDADKAAATIAVRALNIVTGFFLPHIGLPLGPCPYAACEPPAAVDGADQKTRYQMLLPITQIECDSSYLPARFDDPNSEVFAWAVWREYTGCIPGSGQFIWSS